jgi:hypothetical protein
MKAILSLLGGLGIVAGACMPAMAQTVPLLKQLDKFTVRGGPGLGPSETATLPFTYSPPKDAPVWPGKGMTQHPFLYGGEGYNVLSLVKDGKVVWNYGTGPGNEIDDCWMLSNGNIVFTRMQYAEEIRPNKSVVWHYDAPPGTEIHSLQPVGLGKVLIVQNTLPAPLMMMINVRTKKVEWQHALETLSTTDQKTVHAQVRNVRMTAQGTFLVPYLELNKVVEYDKDWKEILSIPSKEPWAALRVPSGNILVAGNGAGWVREFDRSGAIVWEVTKNQLPGITLRGVQGLSRLANGNTIISSNAPADAKSDPTAVQMVEVTPDYKVVWVLQDWLHLGPASWIQLLDEPGIPEKGEVLR